ncbi:MAG: glycosyltransferase family 2 protein [Candidatus Aenigmatarchaeota archaeon]
MKNASKPLVSIVIPTYNSEKTLAKCLESIKNQSYNNIEVIVVDSSSSDRTVKISKEFGVDIIQTNWKLLGARYLGFEKSKGSFILMMDSDQILKNESVIKRALELMKNYDMLVLEEFTYEPNSLIQKLFDADRRLTHKLSKIHIDPLEGVLLARFYKREILENAFKKIPRKLFPSVIAHDHAIIYYEAYKISQKVGILPDACWHIEPNSLWSLVKKNYRYGRSTYDLIKSGYYKDLLKKKVRLRKGALKDWKLGLQSHLLLLIKAIGYYTGYFSAGLGYLVSKVRG